MEEKEKKEFFNGFDDDILDPKDFEDDEEGTDDGEGNHDDKGDDKSKSGKPDDKSNPKQEGAEGSVKTDSAEGDGGEGDNGGLNTDDEAKKAEAEKNAKFAEMRRKREAEEKAAKEEAERLAREAKIKEAAKLEAELGVIKTNPYTEKPITDEEDLRIYKIQKDIADRGGDPMADLPSELAKIERERNAKAKASAEEEAKKSQAIQEKAAKEVNELREKYPNLNTADLAKDPVWLQVSDGKTGRLTLTEIYEYLYVPAKEKAEAEGNNKPNGEPDKTQIDANGKKITKVPSSNSNGGKTSKGYLEMSDEEYLKQEADNSTDFF